MSADKVDVLKNLGTMVAIGLAGLCSNAQAADPSKGANLYSMHCANCHGPSGEPIWPGAPDFRRPGALMKPDSQLLTLLKQGRGVMPGYLGVMRDRDMYDLLAHLRTMN